MSKETLVAAGSVVSLWRYPVKSMMGEELNAAGVTQRGLQGDRAYALIDASNGKVVSAKNPRKWAALFDFRATVAERQATDEGRPTVQITLPDGHVTGSEQNDVEETLSAALGREVRLDSAAPAQPSLEEYWPDMDDLDHRDTVTDEEIAAGTFFDGAPIHLLTTATIDRLRKAYAQGRFEVRRFRPNLVVEPISGRQGFVENEWIGHTLAIGDQVRLNIARRCPRCVMTTLPQGDLPKDEGILRAAVRENESHVGVYASVLQSGTIRRGDPVRLVE